VAARRYRGGPLQTNQTRLEQLRIDAHRRIGSFEDDPAVVEVARGGDAGSDGPRAPARAIRVPNDTGAGIDEIRLHAGLVMNDHARASGRQDIPFRRILDNPRSFFSLAQASASVAARCGAVR
jgi:hypothetical protein